MSLLWRTATEDRGGNNCLICGHPIDFAADDWKTWWDDNATVTDPTSRAANIHKTFEDCQNAGATARNLRGERSREEDD